MVRDMKPPTTIQGDGTPGKNYLDPVLGSINALGKPIVEREGAGDIVREQIDYGPHCEIQMLRSLNKGRAGIWNVMGCNKRPCFACARMPQASDFLFEQSHGTAYRQNFLSAAIRLKAFVYFDYHPLQRGRESHG